MKRAGAVPAGQNPPSPPPVPRRMTARSAPAAAPLPAPALQLRLLGEPVLQWADGARLPLGPERRFQLLAYLAHQADWVSRERLAALFWPDHGAEAARSNLRKVLFRLKGLPAVPPPEEHNGALRWRVATDVQAFEQAAGAGDAASALAHWRGDPWQGLGAEDVPGLAPWLTSERQRLRARWRQLRLDQARAEGRSDQAAGWLHPLLADDPLDEEALSLLVQHELRAGRRAAALQAYERFRDQLQHSLGLEPASATRALLDPSAAPGRVDASGTGPGAGEAAALAAAPVAETDSGPRWIGRQAECLDLQALLRSPGPRWVTLIGPGGIGKTSLARQALQRLAPAWRDGGLLVSLEDLADTAPALGRLAERLATHLAEPLAAHLDPAAQLPRLLQARALLLVLDNLEQLPAAARQLQATLAACPGVQVLATSRERLGLPGEAVYPVQGLPWPGPEDGAQIDGFDAVRLFHRHALAAQPRLRLHEQATDVAALCEFVEGHPLALQLAAAWTRHFRVSEILAELQAGTLAAADAAVDAAASQARHRSIAAAIDHSWQRLVEAERRLLLRLSVCRGGFTIEAARAVAGASLPALAALIDKSLVRRDDGLPEAAARFSLHPLVLQFVAARHDAADRRAARDAHLHHFLGLLARFPHGRWAEQQQFYRQLGPDLENLRLAWQEGVAQRQGAALAAATIGLACLCHARSCCEDGIALAEAAEPLLRSDPLALAQLQCGLALLEFPRGNFARIAELSRQSLRTARRRGHDRLQHFGLYMLATALVSQGHYEAAGRCFCEGLARAQARQDIAGAAAYRLALGDIATQAGRHDEALQHAQQSVQDQIAAGLLRPDTLGDLAQAQRLAGQPEAARQTLARARAELGSGPPRAEHVYLDYHEACAHLAWHDPARAAMLAERAQAQLHLANQPLLPPGIALLRARLAAHGGQPGEALARVREAAATATARGMMPWQLAALLEQALLAAADGSTAGRRQAVALLQLVRGHAATMWETRQRAAAALGPLAAALATEALPAPPTLAAAIEALLDR